LSVAELLDSLADQGFRFEIRGERIHVEPIPDDATVAELRMQRPALLSVIVEHGGRWLIPLASAHRYVLWRGALHNRHLSVCVACGTPPLLHGPGALDDPLIIDDPDEAPLLRVQPVAAARSIVVAELAADIGLSRCGRLCSRCAKIGRVDARGVCTFCLAADRE
jgi:hypothetical protein